MIDGEFRAHPSIHDQAICLIVKFSDNLICVKGWRCPEKLG